MACKTARHHLNITIDNQSCRKNINKNIAGSHKIKLWFLSIAYMKLLMYFYLVNILLLIQTYEGTLLNKYNNFIFPLLFLVLYF